MLPKSRKRLSKPYHHGDLQNALVDAAIEILQRQGPEALTLRSVARAVGVSQAAPYRHFTDRRALMAAIAERGFQQMQQAMVERMSAAGEGRGGLKQVAVAYVEFGLKNAAMYRVMFGPEVAKTSDLPSLRRTGRGVLGFVAEGIRRLQNAGLVGPGDPWLIAVTTWATLHGLVMLTLDGQTEGVSPGTDALIEEATRLMMFGMARRDAAT